MGPLSAWVLPTAVVPGVQEEGQGPGLGHSGKSEWESLDTGALGSQRAWGYSPTLPLPPTPRQFLTFFWKAVVEGPELCRPTSRAQILTLPPTE